MGVRRSNCRRQRCAAGGRRRRAGRPAAAACAPHQVRRRLVSELHLPAPNVLVAGDVEAVGAQARAEEPHEAPAPWGGGRRAEGGCQGAAFSGEPQPATRGKQRQRRAAASGGGGGGSRRALTLVEAIDLQLKLGGVAWRERRAGVRVGGTGGEAVGGRLGGQQDASLLRRGGRGTHRPGATRAGRTRRASRRSRSRTRGATARRAAGEDARFAGVRPGKLEGSAGTVPSLTETGLDRRNTRDPRADRTMRRASRRGRACLQTARHLPAYRMGSLWKISRRSSSGSILWMSESSSFSFKSAASSPESGTRRTAFS